MNPDQKICSPCVNKLTSEALGKFGVDKKSDDRPTDAFKTIEAKTHCVNGHEYTEENTRYSKSGRICRTCQRIWDNRSRTKIFLPVPSLYVKMDVPQKCKKCEAIGSHNFFRDTTGGMESYRCRRCGEEHYAYAVSTKSPDRSKHSS